MLQYMPTRTWGYGLSLLLGNALSITMTCINYGPGSSLFLDGKRRVPHQPLTALVLEPDSPAEYRRPAAPWKWKRKSQLRHQRVHGEWSGYYPTRITCPMRMADSDASLFFLFWFFGPARQKYAVIIGPRGGRAALGKHRRLAQQAKLYRIEVSVQRWQWGPFVLECLGNAGALICIFLHITPFIMVLDSITPR